MNADDLSPISVHLRPSVVAFLAHPNAPFLNNDLETEPKTLASGPPQPQATPRSFRSQIKIEDQNRR